MGWKRRLAILMMSVAFLALWVCPAAARTRTPADSKGTAAPPPVQKVTDIQGTAASARVQSFTDNQGVIHITNRGGANPPKEVAAPTPVPPPRATPQALVGPQPEQASPRPPEPQPQEEAEKPRLPIPGQAEPAAPSAGPEGKPGGAATQTPAAGEGIELGQKAGNPDSGRPEETTKPALPLRRVSLQASSGTGGLAASRRAAPPEGTIRVYRDAKGVLHIENVEPGGPKSAPAPILKASRKPSEAVALQKSRPEVPAALDPDPGPQLPLKKVSYTRDDFLSRAPPGLTPSRKDPALMDGAVRRYRDGRGVLHIDNPGAPEPERPPPRPFLAAALQGSPEGYTPFRTWKEMEKDRAPPLGPSGAKISAFRDRQGRLVIRSTEEGRRISPGLPPGLALAGLDPHISEAAQAYRLPVPLVLALVKVESNFVPWAVSPKGAMGLMQLMPGTATFLGVRDPFSPRENLLGGCRYLRLLLDCFNGSLPLALAAYNAGYQRVIDSGFQIPAIKETQEFVTRVLGIYYQSLNRAVRPAGFT